MKDNYLKSYKTFKIIQLVLLIVFFLTFIIYLKFDPVLRNNIFTNSNLLTICVFLWAFMVFCFISLVLDLSQLEKYITDNHTLNRTAYLDSLTGIPNRQSCDIVFSRYENGEDISSIGCALICISNLPLINEALGRNKGNLLIQDFASVFESVGDNYGFVGRNGGNEFLIVIEDCSEDKMRNFISDLTREVRNYNDSSNQIPVTFKSYQVLNISLKKDSFGELIASLYKEKGKANNG